MRTEELSLFSVDKDYAKETDEALADQNYNKAKRIFDDLREAYNGLKGDDERREKIYAILEEVYAKIKDGLKGKESLEDDLAAFEEGMQALEQKDNAVSAFDKQATSAKRERERNEKELKDILADINTALENKDVKEAIDNYNRLKQAFQNYPSEDKYRKIDWYNQVLGSYEQIKRLQQQSSSMTAAKKAEEAKRKREEEAEKKREAEKKKREEEEAAKRELASQHLKQIKQEVKDLIETLDEGDIKSTTALLIDARHQVAGLGKEYDKEKTALEGILGTVTTRIEFLKKQRKEEMEKQKEEAAKKAKAAEQAAEKAAEEKKRREAQAEREQAIGDANNADELYHKGLQFQHEGKADEAKACFQAILKITPNHLPAQIRLEQLQENNGGHKDASVQS